jgi:TonB family protein
LIFDQSLAPEKWRGKIMLDQLVESKNNRAENRKRGGYLLTTFMLVAGLCFSAVLGSLFAKDLAIGGEGFELSTVHVPLPINENKMPVPSQKMSKREPSQNNKTETITRQSNMLRVNELQPAPNEISVVPNMQKSRPNGYFLVSDATETGFQNSSASRGGRDTGQNTASILSNQSEQMETVEKTIPPPPPPIKKPIAEPAEKRKTTVSEGVVNGKATNLPKPSYPPTARAVHAAGNVNVQVTIDKTGRVIAVKALDGHILLRPAAEKAAWNAKFDPTLLSKQPVEVTGVIVYKFAMQ